MSDLVPELICLGVDAVICGILYKVYSDTNSTIEAVKRAPSLDLETTKDISKYILENGTVSGHDDREITIPYIVVRGAVNPVKSSLESHHSKGVEGVLRQFAIIEHKRTLSRTGFWYDSTRTIQTYTNHVPFYLGSKLPNLVEVSDFSRACELDMETTFDKFDPAPNSLSDHVVGWVVGDRPKGVQSTEKMLVNGTDLTAIGELVLNHEKNQMRIQPPSNGEDYYLIQETSKSLINRFEEGSKIVKMCLIVFGSIGVVIGAYAGWKYYKKWSIHRSAQRTRETLRDIIRDRDDSTQNNAENEENSERNIPEGQTCVVCLGHQREVILMDCGHVCVCADCATEIMRTRPLCPVCRADIARIAPAFIV